MTYTLDGSPVPPKAAQKPQTLSQLGRERTDNYAWMKDPNWQKVMSSPETLDAAIRAHLERLMRFS